MTAAIRALHKSHTAPGEWKFHVGDTLIPRSGSTYAYMERRIIQRLVDVDTGQRFYRFVLGKAGTAVDGAFLMDSHFEVSTKEAANNAVS